MTSPSLLQRHNIVLGTMMLMLISWFAGVEAARFEAAVDVQASMGYGEFFLPDSAFIEDQCQTLSSEPLVGQAVREACLAYTKGEIDRDKWLLQLSPTLRPPPHPFSCPPGVLCMLIPVPPLRPIPQGFATYSLALFPSVHYQKSEVEAIHEAFFTFGDAIGDARAAIWFEPGQTVKFDLRKRNKPPDQVDIRRSKYYCDRFGLNYNDGPYVVTTKLRPDLVGKAEEKIVVQLGGISASRVIRVLNVLEQDLRTGREIRRRALLFEEVKQRLLSVADRHADALKEVVIGLIK